MRKLWQARSSGQSFLSEMRKQEESEKTSEKAGKRNGSTMAMGRRTSLLSLWKTCNRGSQAMPETL